MDPAHQQRAEFAVEIARSAGEVTLEFFRGRLNDQRAPFASSQLGRAVKLVENLCFCFCAYLAALATALKETADPADAFVDELLRDVIEPGLKPRLRRNLSDSRSHRAGTEYADFFCSVSHVLKNLALTLPSLPGGEG